MYYVYGTKPKRMYLYDPSEPVTIFYTLTEDLNTCIGILECQKSTITHATKNAVPSDYKAYVTIKYTITQQKVIFQVFQNLICK